VKFEDKFIAFVDVLGFKGLVEASEAGTGLSLPELMECLTKLGKKADEERFERIGPTTCPQSKYIERNLNFKVTQISDCVIVSSEVSPAGVINLISHCWGAVIELLMKGIMCRGYITRGRIYHQNGQVIGTGYQRAYVSEAAVSAFKIEADERGTPFVEVDQEICQFVEQETDACVKMMFSRMVKTENGTTALFPFQCLSHSFMIGGFGQKFDPKKEKASNDNVRQLLANLKERVLAYVNADNPKAVKKARHYILALENQMAQCNKTDELIDMLCKPLPFRDPQA
jgi:hypothetical protein